jgi:hypothetical protein
LNEEAIVDVKAPGVLDVTVWEQQHSMTVHLVNFTNPMMMKGPFRETIPVDAEVGISMPINKTASGVHLLISGKKPVYKITKGNLHVSVPQLMDHEIIAVDWV